MWPRPELAKNPAWLLLVVGLAGCATDIKSSIQVEARLETEDGLFFIPVGTHGGASLSGSLYVRGSVTNKHEKLAAHDVEIEVRLFRQAGDTKAERWYRYYAIDELRRIPPGKSVKLDQYIKQTMSGYERCEVIVLAASGKSD